MPGKGTPPRTIRVSPTLWAKAKTEAAKRGETVTDAVVRALNEYTSDDEED